MASQEEYTEALIKIAAAYPEIHEAALILASGGPGKAGSGVQHKKGMGRAENVAERLEAREEKKEERKEERKEARITPSGIPVQTSAADSMERHILPKPKPVVKGAPPVAATPPAPSGGQQVQAAVAISEDANSVVDGLVYLSNNSREIVGKVVADSFDDMWIQWEDGESSIESKSDYSLVKMAQTTYKTDEGAGTFQPVDNRTNEILAEILRKIPTSNYQKLIEEGLDKGYVTYRSPSGDTAEAPHFDWSEDADSLDVASWATGYLGDRARQYIDTHQDAWEQVKPRDDTSGPGDMFSGDDYHEYIEPGQPGRTEYLAWRLRNMPEQWQPSGAAASDAADDSSSKPTRATRIDKGKGKLKGEKLLSLVPEAKPIIDKEKGTLTVGTGGEDNPRFTGEWSGPADPDIVRAVNQGRIDAAREEGRSRQIIRRLQENKRERVRAAEEAQTSDSPGGLFKPKVDESNGTFEQRAPNRQAPTQDKKDKPNNKSDKNTTPDPRQR